MASGRDGETSGTPAGTGLTLTGSKGSQNGSITPGQVDSADGVTVVPAVLFSKAAVGWCVLGVDSDEAIGPVLDSRGEGGEGRGGRSISADSDAGGELTEEGKGSRCDLEGTLGVPDNKSIVELLSDGDGGQIPGLHMILSPCRRSVV